MLIVDSREQWTQARSKDTHLKRWFERNGIPYTVRKLDIGDYAMTSGGTVVVDRKESLDELATNLLNRDDSARFWREIRRAFRQHVRLVILCEHGDGIRSIQDVPRWRSKYSTVTGRVLLDAMVRCEMSYGVTFLFCDKSETAGRIMEILEGGSGLKKCRTGS
jgi:ERCC4-type nuclease